MKATALLFSGAMLTVGTLLAAAPASAQQFTMKLSSPTINDVVHEYYKHMKAGIEQRTAGKIKVEIYPANQLGQIPATVEGVALGTIEATSVANGFYISLEPRFQVLDAPGLFPDLMTGYKVLRDPAIRARLATWGENKGIELLAPGLYSPLMLLTHKEIRTVADLQGQKIRTQGGAPIQVEPFKKLGIIPVSLPLALPVIMAGLRIATVSTVALTTVGAIVAYGGLGNLLFDGVTANFKAEVLAASVLCVLLAFALDAVLVIAQRLLTPWTRVKAS